jgi:carbon monoxide dehydrogenase subunit G
MQLEHSFTVPVGIDDAWKVLLDIERVAPCMPGAAIDTVEGDDFTGSVKVKLGPISLTYKGKASFVEKDEAAHRAKIDAQGKDSRGGGTAGAVITATLAADGVAATRVDVITDLNVTGKPAQFGRGVMVEVGNKLIGQFADNLANQLSGDAESTPAAPVKAAAKKAAPAAATKAPATESTVPELATESTVPELATKRPAPAPPAETVEPIATTTSPRVNIDDVEPIDLLASAGPAVAKRAIPLAAALAVLIAVVLVWRRRR